MILNPLQLNSTLAAQLRNVSCITSFRGFQGWRRSFLEKLEPFLDVNGIETAAVAYQSFGNRMTHLMKLIAELETILCLQKSQVRYSHEHCLTSVRARRCLSEISKELCLNAGLLESLLPGTSQQEQKSGYTKLHMGAVFLQDDFAQYTCLVNCEERLTQFRANWGHVVLDGQTLKAIDLFRNQFQIFCDIMADLGLFIVMRKCYEFSQVVEIQDTKEAERFTENVDAKNILAEGVQESSNDRADGEDEESIYHCSFCKMAAMDDGFDASIFCYESIRKGTVVSTKQAFDGGNSSSSLSTSDLTESPRYIPIKKQALATSGTESATTADTTSFLEWSSDCLDDMNRSSNNRSFKTIKESKPNDCGEVVDLSNRQKYQGQETTCGNSTVEAADTKQDCVLPVKKEKLRIIYTWYTRMGQPDRETMKKRIAIVHPDISSEDIDRLPWMRNGLRLNIVKMNAMCLK